MVIGPRFAMAPARSVRPGRVSPRKKAPARGAVRRGLFTARFWGRGSRKSSVSWPQCVTVACQLRLIGSGGMSLDVMASYSFDGLIGLATTSDMPQAM